MINHINLKDVIVLYFIDLKNHANNFLKGHAIFILMYSVIMNLGQKFKKKMVRRPCT